MKVAPIAVSKKRTVMSEELFEAGKKKIERYAAGE